MSSRWYQDPLRLSYYITFISSFISELESCPNNGLEGEPYKEPLDKINSTYQRRHIPAQQEYLNRRRARKPRK